MMFLSVWSQIGFYSFFYFYIELTPFCSMNKQKAKKKTTKNTAEEVILMDLFFPDCIMMRQNGDINIDDVKVKLSLSLFVYHHKPLLPSARN